VTGAALAYMREQGLAASLCDKLQTLTTIGVPDVWQQHLAASKINGERQVRIAAEGALIGSLLEKGLNPGLVIPSDGAGQFAVLLHALCWILAERFIHKLIPVNEL